MSEPSKEAMEAARGCSRAIAQRWIDALHATSNQLCALHGEPIMCQQCLQQETPIIARALDAFAAEKLKKTKSCQVEARRMAESPMSNNTNKRIRVDECKLALAIKAFQQAVPGCVCGVWADSCSCCYGLRVQKPEETPGSRLDPRDSTVDHGDPDE